jgi:hypothetical protein
MRELYENTLVVSGTPLRETLAARIVFDRVGWL